MRVVARIAQLHFYCEDLTVSVPVYTRLAGLFTRSQGKCAMVAIRDWSIRAFIENHDAPRRTALDLVVGAGAVLAAVLARLVLEQVAGGVVPFLLTFPAVIAATLLAGTRAGVLVAVGCQVLTFWFVFPHWLADRGGLSTDLTNLLLSSISVAATIWAAASYRRISGQLRSQCTREVGTLSLLIREMDHRTKNNFQIAAHLLGSQARSTGSSQVAHELETASTRLLAIASVYDNLLAGTRGADQLNLKTYLADVVAQLRDGWLDDRLSIAVRSGDIMLPSSIAMIVGLLVNEWVTNAVKHAFADGQGHIVVDARFERGALIVTVSDDGRGDIPNLKPGTGSRLMDGLAKAIGGSTDVRWDGGVQCRLLLPATAIR